MKTQPMDKRLLDLLTTLRIASDRWRAAIKEVNHRRDLALAWMHEDPFHRTIGEACAHVGLDFATDERKAAKRDVLDVVERLVHEGFDLKERTQGGES